MILSNWNVNSVKQKAADIALFIYEHKPDLVGFCETKLNKKFNFKISGYSVNWCDWNSSGGGVAIAVKNLIPHYQIPQLNSSSFESVGGRVPLMNSQKFRLFNLLPTQGQTYNQRSSIVDDQRWTDNCYGDFNAKYIAWNCPTNNRNGTIICEFSISRNVNIFAPTVPAYVPLRARASPSVIDFVITSPKPPLSLNTLSSDHNPTLFKITNSVTNLPPTQDKITKTPTGLILKKK